MEGFREFYKARHGVWPARASDNMHQVFNNIADAVADYVDLKLNPLPPESGAKAQQFLKGI